MPRDSAPPAQRDTASPTRKDMASPAQSSSQGSAGRSPEPLFKPNFWPPPFRAHMRRRLASDLAASVSGSKRPAEDSLTSEQMLNLVHAHGFMHVTDDAASMPEACGMAASTWLHVLPQDDQAMLAVTYQNHIGAVNAWEQAVAKHGIESQRAMTASRQVLKADHQKVAAVEVCRNRAELLLAAGLQEREVVHSNVRAHRNACSRE